MKQRNIFIVFSIFLLAILFSCENTLMPVNTDDVLITGTTASTNVSKSGSITVRLNSLSDALKETLTGEDGIDDSTAQSRAFVFIKRALIKVKNSSGIVIAETEESLNSVNSGSVTISLNSIPYGNDYYIEVEVYNDSISTTEPVLSGSSPNFNVGISNVTASVPLLPANPIPLISGTPVSVSIVSTIDTPLTLGGEAWFSITPKTDILNLDFTFDSSCCLYMFLFNSDGTNAGSDDINSSMTWKTDYFSKNTTYYMAIVSIAASSTINSVAIRYSDANPIAKDNCEPNDGFETAADIVIGNSYNLSFDSSEDSDYFSFSVAEGNYYIIDPGIYGDSTDSIYFSLYSYDNNYLTLNKINTDSDNYLEHYFISDYSGICYLDASGSIGEYSLSLTEIPAPAADFSASVSTTEVNTEITFDASGSSVSEGAVSSYTWHFGDSSEPDSNSGVSVNHSYTSVGEYWVTLLVKDSRGAEGRSTKKIRVNDGTTTAPTANAGPDQNINTDTDGKTVTLDGSSSTAAAGIASYSWKFLSYPSECYSPDSNLINPNTASASFDIDSVGGNPNSDGKLVYVLLLEVTDNNGATSSDFVTITVTGSGSAVIIIE